MMRGSRVLGAAAVLFAISAAGCGQGKMMEVQKKVREAYARGDWQGAAALYSKKDKDGKPEAFEPRDRVAYWLNLAMFLHMTDKYKESNDLLDKAVKRHDELYTTSVSKSAASLVTSDAVQDYEGADFEIVLSYPLSMLNYATMNEGDKALVQARALDERLKKLATKYGEKKGPTFNQDAFSRWLAGVIQEGNGENNEALISYKNAFIAYRDLYGKSFLFPTPRYLFQDIVRVATKLGGFESDVEKAKKYSRNDPDIDATNKVMASHGEIILVHGAGEVPQKKDFFITCTADKLAPSCDAGPGEQGFSSAKIIPKPGADTVRVAIPMLDFKPWKVAAAKMSVWKPGEMEAAKASKQPYKGMPSGVDRYDPMALKASSLAALASARDAARRLQSDPGALAEMQMYLRLAIYLANRAVWLDPMLANDLARELNAGILEVRTAYAAAITARQKDAKKDSTGYKPEEALGPMLSAPVSLAGNEALTVPAEPIAAIAIKDHADAMTRNFIKVTASAVTKLLLSKAGGSIVGKIFGDTAGKIFSFGAQAAMNAAAEADKRQWFTLPAVYNVARYWAEPGEYDVELTFYSANGAVIKHDVKKGVKVAAGKKTFINYRTID